MSGSLQDQLLKAGLVTEEQLETARTKPPRPPAGGRGKPRGKGRGKPGRGNPRTEGSGAEGERRDAPGRGDRRPGPGKSGPGKAGPGKPGRNRSGPGRPGPNKPAQAKPGQGRSAKAGKVRNPQPELSPEERALRDRVHAMITESAESREGGETAFHFVKGSRIKRIYVTDAQRGRLASDELAVAAMKGKHFLVPRTVADEIKALIPGYFIAMGSVEADTTSTDDVDDEYAEFQVPDDLIW